MGSFPSSTAASWRSRSAGCPCSSPHTVRESGRSTTSAAPCSSDTHAPLELAICQALRQKLHHRSTIADPRSRQQGTNASLSTYTARLSRNGALSGPWLGKENKMATITTRDGVEIYYKDWGPKNAQPIVFHHGWPLSSDDWDTQM